MLRKSPEPRNVAKVTALKLEYLQKKKTANSVQLVVANMYQQMEDDNKSESEEETDVAIFQSGVDTKTESQASPDQGGGTNDNDGTDEEICASLVDITFSDGTSHKFQCT